MKVLGFRVHKGGSRVEGGPANVSEEQDGLAFPSMPAFVCVCACVCVCVCVCVCKCV